MKAETRSSNPRPESSSGGSWFDHSGDALRTPLVGSSGMVYRPFLLLGEGGMARVFLAHAAGSSGFAKLVVLKVARQRVDALGDRDLFLKEAWLTARFNHPNLVQVYEVVQTGDTPYLVMEYLDGQPLSRLREGKQLGRPMMLAIVSEALVGLHHVHELKDFDGLPLNIVHRDVSPHNIFVTYDGVVKVLDFGIAKSVVAVDDTRTGEVKGKLRYMAPEQLLGEAVDRRADVFAMGAILWEMAVGAPMWRNVTEPNLIHRLAKGDIPRPSEHATVEPELERIIVKASAADAGDRYATALELQQELEAYLTRCDDSSSMRSIGLALGAAFEPERAEAQRAISLALRESKAPPPMVAAELASPADSEQVAVSPQEAKEATGAQSRARGRWSLPALATTVAFALGGALLIWRPPLPGPPPEVAALRPSLTPEPPIRISVRVTPAESTIELDGKQVGIGEATLAMAADSAEHQLTLAAPGYVRSTRTLKFDRAQDLNVALERESAAMPAPELQVPSATSRRQVAPAARRGAGAPRESRPAPAAESPCDPPYFFKGGIKTYKPECL